MPTKVVMEIKDFDPTDFIDKKKPKEWMPTPSMLYQRQKWSTICRDLIVVRCINIDLVLLWARVLEE